jgi:hypothetical protein
MNSHERTATWLAVTVPHMTGATAIHVEGALSAVTKLFTDVVAFCVAVQRSGQTQYSKLHLCSFKQTGIHVCEYWKMWTWTWGFQCASTTIYLRHFLGLLKIMNWSVFWVGHFRVENYKPSEMPPEAGGKSVKVIGTNIPVKRMEGNIGKCAVVGSGTARGRRWEGRVGVDPRDLLHDLSIVSRFEWL